MSTETTSPVCSAKGCKAPATWVLAWNNPKLHAPERRKTWTACDDHREHLTGFLETRGFLRQTVPYAEWPADEPTEPRCGQPPMADIGRVGCRKPGSSMP